MNYFKNMSTDAPNNKKIIQLIDDSSGMYWGHCRIFSVFNVDI